MTRHLPFITCSLTIAALCACASLPELDPTAPDGADAVVADSPTAPPDEAGTALSWPPAPLMEGVKVVVNRDSAVLVVPPVAGARDYRAFRVPAGTRIGPGAYGDVRGTVIHCAGHRQRNDAAPEVPTLLRQVEVTDLSGPTRIVIEAIDAMCPFPGPLGSEHATVQVDISELPPHERRPFQVFTEDEIRATYGSLIVNGHGPGPVLGDPAPAPSPRVLARTTVVVTPTGAPPPGTGTFFDSFDDDADQPALVRELPDSGGRSQRGRELANSRFGFYSWGAELSQLYVRRGQLHTVLSDWGQDIFSSNVAIPRRTAALSDTSYLHVHFEIATNATARRYWWVFLCGAESLGQTLDENGLLRAQIVQTPFFYDPDGRNPSLAGWNCLQVFPLDGSPFPLEPTGRRPESDLRLIVNVPNGTQRDNVRQVSPDQYGNSHIAAKGWYRQQRGNGGALGAPVLDDQMLIAPRTRMDLYVRRDRTVIYVNGEQRVCNDYPNARLTMAEAAVGFGTVLYHSAAERGELVQPFNDRSGQFYYLRNTPFVDGRSWDNLGFEENVAEPPAFDAGACFVAP